MDDSGLSKRGAANVEAIWPRIANANSERKHQQHRSCIDMATSENWLLRHELLDLYKKAVQDGLSEKVR